MKQAGRILPVASVRRLGNHNFAPCVCVGGQVTCGHQSSQHEFEDALFLDIQCVGPEGSF
jgi:hypothetical protein